MQLTGVSLVIELFHPLKLKRNLCHVVLKSSFYEMYITNIYYYCADRKFKFFL